jgi:hypothetical protein
VGTCTILHDCYFGNYKLPAGTNLSNTTLLGPIALPPNEWTCAPNVENPSGIVSCPCPN